MPRTCTVCRHDEAHAINVALVQRDGYRTIAHHYEVSVDALKRQLEAAERTYSIMERALVSAQADLSEFMAEHGGELYRDVAQARSEVAAKASVAASEALQAYSKWSDLHYVLKDLAPPPPQPDHNQPAERLTQTVIGIHTTQSSGPDRGAVEQMLQHVISLGEDARGTAPEGVPAVSEEVA